MHACLNAPDHLVRPVTCCIATSCCCQIAATWVQHVDELRGCRDRQQHVSKEEQYASAGHVLGQHLTAAARPCPVTSLCTRRVTGRVVGR